MAIAALNAKGCSTKMERNVNYLDGFLEYAEHVMTFTNAKQ